MQKHGPHDFLHDAERPVEGAIVLFMSLFMLASCNLKVLF